MSEARLLEVAGINSYYGKSHILHDVSLHVEQGEIVTLLGLNGAGKTTTLRSIMGLTPPQTGSVKLSGRELRGMPPHAVARLGVGYVPEGRRMFKNLSTLENLQLAERAGGAQGWTISRVYDRFPKLKELASRKSGRLSGGEQEMLAIGRALVGNPQLILVDEPSQGLAPIIVIELYKTLEELRREGASILLVEQNALLALRVSQRAYVVDDGRIVHTGPADELVRDQARIRMLMGLREDEEIPA